MNRVLRLLLFVLWVPALVLAQTPATRDKNTASQGKSGGSAQSSMPPAPPFLSPKICGKGVFLFSLDRQPFGRETFEITCKPDGGYSGSGNTSMKLPSSFSLTQDVTIEVDKAGLPLSLAVKGEANGTPVEQTTIFKENRAMVTTGGETKEVAYTSRAPVIVNNAYYLLQFIAASYDMARGGEQTFPLYPGITASMERTGRDDVSASNLKASAPSIIFDRYSLNIAGATFIFWADAQGRIAVIFIPAQKFVAAREEYAAFVEPLRSAAIAKVKGIVPDYSAPANAPFTAEEVSVQAKGFKLAGTLLLPKMGKRPFPAVVMSTGSGQEERDSKLPGLEDYKPFRQIAEYLAARGIAVLRADDRGIGSSGGAETLMTSTTFDFADDVRAQVAYLRTRSDIDPARISVIGHSEGGVIAPLVAASDPKLAAIVLLAGTAKRGEDVLRFQLNYGTENNSKLSEEEKAKRRAETEGFLRAIKENGDVSKYPAPLRPLNSPWGRAFLDYDPTTTIRKVRQPVLILQGALDKQVTAEQARMLEEAARAGGNKDVTVRIFPNLNHLFLPAKTGAETEYTNLETYSLSDEVLKAMADWLQVKLKVGK
ncbi:MAG TPA: alpha/beta fold hydrolase [Pyrinomonadaceae bacterium]|jgi:alpha-beta hydrolase superfamily lysophospholipase